MTAVCCHPVKRVKIAGAIRVTPSGMVFRPGFGIDETSLMTDDGD
jgi:hypothetical protein